MWLKSHVPWTIPEQLFFPRAPGHPPLSLWIAHIDSVLIPFDWANASSCCASAGYVTSVYLG